jgi:RND superfamily putative drug exporter
LGGATPRLDSVASRIDGSMRIRKCWVMSAGSATVRVARWSATHPWRAIALWTVFVALCFLVGSAAGVKELDIEQSFGESGRADQIVRSGEFPDPVTENVLITARSGQLDRVEADSAAATVTERMSARREVASVAPPVLSPAGDAVLVRLTLTAEPSNDQVQALLDTTEGVQQEHPTVRVEQVGNASIGKAFDETLGRDFQRAEVLSLPVTLLILLIAFGALIAAGIPLLLAVSAVAAAIGLSAVASHLIPAVDTTKSMILLIGLAVGVDYSLFYIRREREERARGLGHVDAVEIAAATSGHAVVVSGIAVVISMAGLYLAGDQIFSSLATGAVLVVAIAVLGSLTVLPAMLAKLGRWVDRPRVPLLWRLAARSGEPRLWPALLRPALRHPVITLLVSVGALVAVAVPALDMRLRMLGPDDLPRTPPVMQAYDRLTAAFPSTGTTHLVAVRAPVSETAAVRAALEELASRVARDPMFARDSLAEPTVSADGRVAYLEVATRHDPGAAEAVESLEALRRDLVPATVGRVPGAEYAVGGFVAFNEDYAGHMGRRLPLVIGVVLLLTFVVMTLTFRSVVVALTAIALNLLSAAAAYGVLQLVFGGTWAEDLLDFRTTGAIVSWIPLFLFVVLFGLSMDYHVFVVSRIREAVLRGVPTRQAVSDGISRSAGVVSSAAVVMVAVFSVFATLSTVDFKQLGVGLAAAILIDATVIRAVVLPSLMTLLGRANWWAPRWLRGAPPPAWAPTPVPVLSKR